MKLYDFVIFQWKYTYNKKNQCLRFYDFMILYLYRKSYHIFTTLPFLLRRRGRSFHFELNFYGCGEFFLNVVFGTDVEVLSKFFGTWMSNEIESTCVWCPKGLHWRTMVFSFGRTISRN